MTKPLLFELKNAPQLVRGLFREQSIELGWFERRRFPDGESYVRLLTPVAGREVMILCTLDRPDDATLPLLFLAAALREQGARCVGLVAPYLAYLRQDRAFHPGEAVTSVTYARLLSSAFDWLVTVDPHLHRYAELGAVYSIPTAMASATGPIADWIRKEIPDAVVIGPDAESAQWIDRVAARAGVPSLVFEKDRRGDRNVVILPNGIDAFPGRTPVLVDDIVSSAGTMIECVRLLKAAGSKAPVCVAVHAIFAGDAHAALVGAGAARIVTANTVSHPSNAIDVGDELATAIAAILGGESSHGN